MLITEQWKRWLIITIGIAIGVSITIGVVKTCDSCGTPDDITVLMPTSQVYVPTTFVPVNTQAIDNANVKVDADLKDLQTKVEEAKTQVSVVDNVITEDVTNIVNQLATESNYLDDKVGEYKARQMRRRMILDMLKQENQVEQVQPPTAEIVPTEEIK